eukprot:365123-Prorocentrum_minimum.AAC.1
MLRTLTTRRGSERFGESSSSAEKRQGKFVHGRGGCSRGRAKGVTDSARVFFSAAAKVSGGEPNSPVGEGLVKWHRRTRKMK